MDVKGLAEEVGSRILSDYSVVGDKLTIPHCIEIYDGDEVHEMFMTRVGKRTHTKVDISVDGYYVETILIKNVSFYLGNFIHPEDFDVVLVFNPNDYLPIDTVKKARYLVELGLKEFSYPARIIPEDTYRYNVQTKKLSKAPTY